MKKIFLSLVIASALMPSYSNAATADTRGKKLSLLGTGATIAGTTALTILLAHPDHTGKGIVARGILASILTAAGLVLVLSPDSLVEKYDAVVAHCCTK